MLTGTGLDCRSTYVGSSPTFESELQIRYASAGICMILVSWIRVLNPHSKCEFQMQIQIQQQKNSEIQKFELLKMSSI
jgi:hypothetical protein